jgi:concanavalin A-like lectin/glucanase superfamily protein
MALSPAEGENDMTANSAPRTGDIYLKLNGLNNFVEIPSSTDYSIATTGELSVAAWIRPDTLNFPSWERAGYVHWLGKGEGSGDTGQQEWVFRIYNRDHTTEHPPRPNRISFYTFNPEGGEGVGSYFQDTLNTGEWIFVVGVADATRTYMYRDGQYRRCDTYRGPSTDHCPIHYQPPPNENLQLEINPAAGASPLRLGTRDLNSFFEGGLSRVRIWSRVLEPDEVSALYLSDAAPSDGLVAEFLLNADTGTTAADSARGNDGTIFGAVWDLQQ